MYTLQFLNNQIVHVSRNICQFGGMLCFCVVIITLTQAIERKATEKVRYICIRPYKYICMCIFVNRYRFVDVDIDINILIFFPKYKQNLSLNTKYLNTYSYSHKISQFLSKMLDSFLLQNNYTWIFLFFSFKILFIYFQTEEKGGRKRGRETPVCRCL